MWDQRPAVIGNAGTCLAYVTHDAFARDLHNLIDACLAGRIWRPAAAATLGMFTLQLQIYLRAADELLWTELRTVPAATGTLDELDAKRALLQRSLSDVSEAFATREIASLFDRLRQLSRVLDGLMRHVEDDVLPLVAHQLAVTTWDAFVARVRALQGRGGAARYFPWLLDAATASTEHLLLGLLPAPMRPLHHLLWLPTYRRTHLAVRRRRRPAAGHRQRAVLG